MKTANKAEDILQQELAYIRQHVSEPVPPSPYSGLAKLFAVLGLAIAMMVIFAASCNAQTTTWVQKPDPNDSRYSYVNIEPFNSLGRKITRVAMVSTSYDLYGKATMQYKLKCEMTREDGTVYYVDYGGVGEGSFTIPTTQTDNMIVAAQFCYQYLCDSLIFIDPTHHPVIIKE